jgi:hypothetical protein
MYCCVLTRGHAKDQHHVPLVGGEAAQLHLVVTVHGCNRRSGHGGLRGWLRRWRRHAAGYRQREAVSFLRHYKHLLRLWRRSREGLGLLSLSHLRWGLYSQPPLDADGGRRGDDVKSGTAQNDGRDCLSRYARTATWKTRLDEQVMKGYGHKLVVWKSHHRSKRLSGESPGMLALPFAGVGGAVAHPTR